VTSFIRPGCESIALPLSSARSSDCFRYASRAISASNPCVSSTGCPMLHPHRPEPARQPAPLPLNPSRLPRSRPRFAGDVNKPSPSLLRQNPMKSPDFPHFPPFPTSGFFSRDRKQRGARIHAPYRRWLTSGGGCELRGARCQGERGRRGQDSGCRAWVEGRGRWGTWGTCRCRECLLTPGIKAA
jgi:hypothetical protein